MGTGSIQRFLDADFAEHYFTLLESPRYLAQLRRIAGFDLLANNADRKGGHVLVDGEEHLWGIDHGLCFHVDTKVRTVMWEFAGEPLPDEVAAACRQLADELPASLERLLGEDERDALRARARRLAKRPVFPAPRDDYRAYPWPLV